MSFAHRLPKDKQEAEESYFEKKEIFFEYIDGHVDDEEMINDYFAVHSTQAREFVEVCAWINRQFKIDDSQQKFIFSDDLYCLKNGNLGKNAKTQENRTRQSLSSEEETAYKTTELQTKIENKDIPVFANACILHLNRFSEFLRSREAFKTALELDQEALRIEDAVFEKKRPTYSFALYKLAVALAKVSRLQEAEATFEAALAEAERMLGKDPLETASWMNNFGVCMRAQGRLDKGLAYLERALLLDKTAIAKAEEERIIALSHATEEQKVQIEKAHLEVIDEAKENVAFDLHNLARIYVDFGKLSKAAEFEQEALKIDKERFEKGETKTVPDMVLIIDIYIRLSRFNEAERMLETELETRKSTLGDESVEVAKILKTVANLKLKQGQPEAAAKLMLESLEIYRLVDYRTVRDELSEELLFLGDVYTSLGEKQTALKFLKEGLETLKETVEPKLELIAKIYHDMGELHRALGEYDAAVTCLTQSIEVRKRIMGPMHPLLAETMSSLAFTYGDMGKMNESADCHNFALQVYRNTHGKNSEKVASTLNNMAMCLSDLGVYDDALAFAEESLEIRENRFGAGHHIVAQTLNNKACILRAMGRLEEAEYDYSAAILIGERTLGRAHPDVALRRNNLAEVYMSMHMNEKAEPLLREAIKHWSEDLGPDHPRVGIGLNNLAVLLGDEGRYEEAIPLQRQLLLIDQAEYGQRNVFVARDLNNLGRYLRKNEQLNEAEVVIRKGLKIRQEILPAKHQHIGSSLDNLAHCLLSKGETELALKTGKKALAIFSASLNEDHDWVIKAKQHWGG